LRVAGVEFIAGNGSGAGVRFSKHSGRPDEGLRPVPAEPYAHYWFEKRL
jgi:hypothetical protein